MSQPANETILAPSSTCFSRRGVDFKLTGRASVLPEHARKGPLGVPPQELPRSGLRGDARRFPPGCSGLFLEKAGNVDVVVAHPQFADVGVLGRDPRPALVATPHSLWRARQQLEA